MGKRLFLLLISSLLGIVMMPGFLTAEDKVKIVSINDSKAVETVEVTETQTEEKIEAPVTYTYSAPVVNENVTPPLPANAITIAGRTLEIVDVADTAVDAGNHVNKYGAKFLYGHNTSAVFANVLNVTVGDVFTVAYGGTAQNYQVLETQRFEKASDYALRDLDTSIEYRMRAIADGKGKYDMVIMTCIGEGYDTPYRYVLFAKAI